jgi:hypothetical protein
MKEISALARPGPRVLCKTRTCKAVLASDSDGTGKPAFSSSAEFELSERHVTDESRYGLSVSCPSLQAARSYCYSFFKQESPKGLGNMIRIAIGDAGGLPAQKMSP